MEPRVLSHSQFAIVVGAIVSSAQRGILWKPNFALRKRCHVSAAAPLSTLAAGCGVLRRSSFGNKSLTMSTSGTQPNSPAAGDQDGTTVELHPVTVKAIAWLKRVLVEKLHGDSSASTCIATACLCDLFTSWGIDAACVSTDLKDVSSFLDFLEIVQKHAPLDKKVKELTRNYVYADIVVSSEYVPPLTILGLKKMVTAEPDGAWSLTDKEVADVIRVVEFGGKFTGNLEDDQMVLKRITL